MIIKIRVIPNSKKNEIAGGDPLRIKLNAPAEKGRANSLLLEVLASHFNVKKNKIKIIKGRHSRDKTVEMTSPAG